MDLLKRVDHLKREYLLKRVDLLKRVHQLKRVDLFMRVVDLLKRAGIRMVVDLSPMDKVVMEMLLLGHSQLEEVVLLAKEVLSLSHLVVDHSPYFLAFYLVLAHLLPRVVQVISSK